jgi:hypothetical protein
MFDEWSSYQEYNGQKNLYATTATQWSSICGERILREYELSKSIENILENVNYYNPREFILNRVNDHNSMIQIINCLNNLSL